MLIKCPECQLQISDKALSCPHCGLPFNNQPRKQRTKSRMRLPNGFGEISFIKNRNLRNPYRAMITVGKTDEGKPIRKILKPQGYFASYNDAYAALVEYNKNPYDLDSDISVLELYNKWSEVYFSKISDSSKRTITSSWSYCKSVENIKVKALRSRHIKLCMDSCESVNIRNRIKSMFNIMLDYAVEFELVDKNVARDFNIEKVEVKSEHKAFTDEELNILWANTSDPLVNIILFQCYTGWRPQELCAIKLENIKGNVIIAGMKTDAGKDRPVPIPSVVNRIFENLLQISHRTNSNYLICNLDGSQMTYDSYYKKFKKTLHDLNIKDHRPHDPRKTFVTLCKNFNVDEYAIKYLVGHSITDITEAVYTDRNIEWLTNEIEKIKRTR